MSSSQSDRTSTVRSQTVRSGIGTDLQHGAVVPPLHLSSNFTFEGFEVEVAPGFALGEAMSVRPCLTVAEAKNGAFAGAGEVEGEVGTLDKEAVFA